MAGMLDSNRPKRKLQYLCNRTTGPISAYLTRLGVAPSETQHEPGSPELGIGIYIVNLKVLNRTLRSRIYLPLNILWHLCRCLDCRSDGGFISFPTWRAASADRAGGCLGFV